MVRNALEFNIEGRKERGRPKQTLRKQVEEECLKAGLNLKNKPTDNLWNRINCIGSQTKDCDFKFNLKTKPLGL